MEVHEYCLNAYGVFAAVKILLNNFMETYNQDLIDPLAFIIVSLWLLLKDIIFYTNS